MEPVDIQIGPKIHVYKIYFLEDSKTVDSKLVNMKTYNETIRLVVF